MEILGYGYVAGGIITYVVALVMSITFIGYSAVRFTQCLWSKVTGKTKFTSCLFCTGADPTET